MAQRILEKQIISLAPIGDGTPDLAFYCQVAFIDTLQDPPVTEEFIWTRVDTAMTLAQLEAARRDTYKARMVELFGSAPATALLIGLKSV